MPADMTTDIFAQESYGKKALEKMRKAHGELHPNFRLFLVEWLGEKPPFEIMRVVGAQFRKATRGPNKGKLCILVPGSKLTTHLTAAEVKE